MAGKLTRKLPGTASNITAMSGFLSGNSQEKPASKSEKMMNLMKKSLGGSSLNKKDFDRFSTSMTELTSRVSSTLNLLNANQNQLKKLAAEGNTQAELLLNEIKNASPRLATLQKASKGKSVSEKEAEEARNYLNRIGKLTDQIGVSLEVPMSKIFDNLTNVIENSNTSSEFRLKALQDFFTDFEGQVGKKASLEERILELQTRPGERTLGEKEQLGVMEKQLSLLDKLSRLTQTGVGLDRESINHFRAIGGELKEAGMSDKSSLQSLRELDTKFDFMAVNLQNIEDFSRTQTSQGGTLKQQFSKFANSNMVGGIKEGLISYLLGSVGLDGLESMLPMVAGVGGKALGAATSIGRGAATKIGAFGKGVGTKIGAFGKGVGTTIGAIPEAASKLGGRIGSGVAGAGKMGMKGLTIGAKALGKLAIPLTAGLAALDFGLGWSGAEKIAGLDKGKKATTGQKTQAGFSKTISGLTLGLVESSTIYESFEDVKNMFADSIDSVSDVTKKAWKRIEEDWEFGTESLTKFFSGYTEKFSKMAEETWDWLGKKWESGMESLKGFFGGIWGSVKDSFSGLFGDSKNKKGSLWESGMDALKGFFGGKNTTDSPLVGGKTTVKVNSMQAQTPFETAGSEIQRMAKASAENQAVIDFQAQETGVTNKLLAALTTLMEGPKVVPDRMNRIDDLELGA